VQGVNDDGDESAEEIDVGLDRIVLEGKKKL